MSDDDAVELNLFPCLYYDDAVAAIEWLCDAFGFRARLVVPGSTRHGGACGAEPRTR